MFLPEYFHGDNGAFALLVISRACVPTKLGVRLSSVAWVKRNFGVAHISKEKLLRDINA